MLVRLKAAQMVLHWVGTMAFGLAGQMESAMVVMLAIELVANWVDLMAALLAGRME